MATWINNLGVKDGRRAFMPLLLSGEEISSTEEEHLMMVTLHSPASLQ
jgi:hypothetical protein